MSGFRDRMNRLRGGGEETSPSRSAALPDSSVEEKETDPAEAAWRAMGVVLRQTDKGSYLQRRTQYPATHRHGIHALSEWRDAEEGLRMFHHSRGEIGEEAILYLDLETTGLGSGTGNVPFMVGLSYMENGFWVVEQNLIRHPSEERAMLHDLALRIGRCSHLATYNGKSFDWPLVKSRMIMNSIPLPSEDPQHLDFLHPSRSIWRNTLPSLKLSYVEEERLGIQRVEDVPGSLAPSLYFQYLASGDPAPLDGVFRHNESDLLSLVCLSVRFGLLLRGEIFNRIPYPEEAEELVRSGLWLEKMGLGPLAEPLYLLADGKDADNSLWLKLAERDKKAGNFERAVLLWQKVVSISGSRLGPDAQEACVQLSMHFEHRVKDLHQGLHYAQLALRGSEERESLLKRKGKRKSDVDGMRARVERLWRKTGVHHRLECGE
ncbi:ribonuclease H-like domain-containing protein [Paenibacillus sp. CAU 1782]